MHLSGRPSRMMRTITCALYAQVALTSAQVSFNANSYSSIRSFTSLLAKDIFSIYIGDQPGQTPGMLPGSGVEGGYFWWVGGGLFGCMIDYWRHTGDDTYVARTREAIAFQSAPSEGGYFEPHNETLQLGNDDISFWAFAALMAAEYNFPAPPSWAPSWLAMVQGAWNRQAYRWDHTCGGGLRWQVSTVQGTGYYYKNSISNGCFFNIGARLAKYTGNSTYARWAEKTWDWTVSSGLMDDSYNIYDGLSTDDCSHANHIEQWSYNTGVYLYGAAVMWNFTGDDLWKQRTQGLLDSAARLFFKADESGNKVLTEIICEPSDTCGVDQSTFKGYLSRFARASTEVASWTQEQVDAMFQYSAPAAASVCQTPGGDGGLMCGEKWYTTYDGQTGIGMNMNAMEVMQALIPAGGPLSLDTGAKSKSHPAAGSGDGLLGLYYPNAISVTTADKAGAAILTILLTVSTLGGAWWIVK